LLLDYAADINAKDKNGATALMAASEARNAELVKLLLDHGADVNIQDKQGKTAYMLTSDSVIKEILIKNGANVS
jgi:ankyrin repeat protein